VHRNSYLDRPAPNSLAEVMDTILDKGLVVDGFTRVSLVGLEVLSVDGPRRVRGIERSS
jgi:hypothetical protein